MLHERKWPAAGDAFLTGEDFATSQRALAAFNQTRLTAGLGEREEAADRGLRNAALALEEEFVAAARLAVAPLIADVPDDANGFIAWFQAQEQHGPGQGDPLFPWLAETASYAQIQWFLAQEVAGEAGFDDLVALSQVKMPVRPKLEMARNYWDEMGRGQEKGMHGPMLSRLAEYFGLRPAIRTTVPESIALGNMMMALACNRRYAYHSIGALGVIELTAPTRATYVAQALDRIGVPKKQSHYFSLHAVLDVKHSQAWNAEVLWPLVEEDSRRARAIAEGTMLRLWCGACCFERYRREFGI